MAAFNGTTVSFAAAPLTPLVSVSYEGSCADVDVGGAGDSDEVVETGTPDESVTVEIMGSASVLIGATGATAVAWNGGGTLGSFASAICTAVSDGGGYDGQITTSYTFKPTG